MNREVVDKIARAVLYEGYVLYPYRPSIKSRQRWTFGGVYPKAWSELQGGSDAWGMRTEVLVSGEGEPGVRVLARFLHLIDRTVCDVEMRHIGTLDIGQRRYHDWQEAGDRELDLGEFDIGELVKERVKKTFGFAADRTVEILKDDGGKIVGNLVREQQAIAGEIEISAVELAEGLRKVSVSVSNLTALEDAGNRSRDDALMRSLVSTHVILGVSGGEFVSLTDPGARWKEFAAECRNVGAWPVLVGEEGARDTILASPIILYDYPQLAPESPGDLFDSTEIDEILTLRILTLTDGEKRAAAGVDHRTRDLMARTEALDQEQLMKLHGTMRGLRPVAAQEETR